MAKAEESRRVLRAPESSSEQAVDAFLSILNGLAGGMPDLSSAFLWTTSIQEMYGDEEASNAWAEVDAARSNDLLGPDNDPKATRSYLAVKHHVGGLVALQADFFERARGCTTLDQLGSSTLEYAFAQIINLGTTE